VRSLGTGGGLFERGDVTNCNAWKALGALSASGDRLTERGDSSKRNVQKALGALAVAGGDILASLG
jgi:hypothetical protein